jgi:glucose-1-phosphate cytidylyltransferase
METVIFAGGLGTRLREETEYKPKPMIRIGGYPIIWHIMKRYAKFGHKDFITCLGYRGDAIREYFLNFHEMNNDCTITLSKDSKINIHESTGDLNWNVTLAETGESTLTGGRLLRIKNYITENTFMCTYGDGLADVNIAKLLDFHKSHGKIATLTAVQPISRFGVVETNANGTISSFKEKPQMEDWVNSGFFVFNTEIFDFLSENCALETEPLNKLVQLGELMAYKHHGFFQAMDTYREMQLMNSLWDSGNIPWES